MVGVASEPRVAGTVVSAARIEMFAATVHVNSLYWDADFATKTWGRAAGAACIRPYLPMGWLVPLPWEP